MTTCLCCTTDAPTGPDYDILSAGGYRRRPAPPAPRAPAMAAGGSPALQRGTEPTAQATPTLADLTGAVAACWARFQANAHTSWPNLPVAHLERMAEPPTVVIRPRMTAAAGKAYLARGLLVLSREYLQHHPTQMVEQTLPHEVAHFIAWRVFKDGGHGVHWKAVMRALGCPADVKHRMELPVAYIPLHAPLWFFAACQLGVTLRLGRAAVSIDGEPAYTITDLCRVANLWAEARLNGGATPTPDSHSLRRSVNSAWRKVTKHILRHIVPLAVLV